MDCIRAFVDNLNPKANSYLTIEVPIKSREHLGKIISGLENFDDWKWKKNWHLQYIFESIADGTTLVRTHMMDSINTRYFQQVHDSFASHDDVKMYTTRRNVFEHHNIFLPTKIVKQYVRSFGYGIWTIHGIVRYIGTMRRNIDKGHPIFSIEIICDDLEKSIATRGRIKFATSIFHRINMFR